MKKNPVLLTIQSVLCLLTAIALIVADLIIYFQGLSEKNADPMASIYTADAIADQAILVMPLIIASLIVTVICAIRRAKGGEAAGVPRSLFIKPNNEDGMSGSAVTAVRIIILALAVLFIIIGLFNGSLEDVFIKASRICTECIGLG